MSTPWASASGRRQSPIQEIINSGNGTRTVEPPPSATSRYGEEKRQQQEREQIRESYLAIDVRLQTGELRGFFYFDLAGSPMLDSAHTTLTVPFRDSRLIIRGYRLLPLYRSILHHSLDVLELNHRPEFDNTEAPVITAIDVVERESEV